jgi:hypothetical protein
LDITLFLAKRGLPFRGITEKLGDPHNGLFLGICELLARYDKVLELHLAAVKEAQDSNRRMQVTYLSKETQNEFIECCANAVRTRLLKEIEDSKYYAVIVDATPDTGPWSKMSLSYATFTAIWKDNMRCRNDFRILWTIKKDTVRQGKLAHP